MHSSVVYFIYAPHCRAIKIGTTTDIDKRLDSLQHAHPDKLILLGTIPGNDKEELELHIQFDHLRRLGEWFTDAYELQHYITQICGRYDALKTPNNYLETNIDNVKRQLNSDTIVMSNLMKVLVFCCPSQNKWKASDVMYILSAALDRHIIDDNNTRKFLRTQSWRSFTEKGEQYYSIPSGIKPDINKEHINLATQLIKKIWENFQDNDNPFNSMPRGLQNFLNGIAYCYEIDDETIKALIEKSHNTPQAKRMEQ